MSDRFYPNFRSSTYNYASDYKPSSSNSFLRHSQSGTRQTSWNEQLQKKLSSKGENTLEKMQRLQRQYQMNEKAAEKNLQGAPGKAKYQFLRHTIDYHGKGYTPDQYNKMGRNKDHYQSSNALRKYTADNQDNLESDKKFKEHNYANHEPKQIDFLARDYYYKTKKTKAYTDVGNSGDTNDEDLSFKYTRTAKSPRHRFRTEGEYTNQNLSYSGSRGYGDPYTSKNYQDEVQQAKSSTYAFEKKYDTAIFSKKPSYHYYTPKSDSQNEISSPTGILKKPPTPSSEVESPMKKISKPQSAVTMLNQGPSIQGIDLVSSKYEMYSPTRNNKFSGSWVKDKEDEVKTPPSSGFTLEKINISLGAMSIRESIKNSGQLCLADFQIGKSLGQGKFGNVYLAVHKRTKFLFALKKVKKDQIKQHKLENQFMMQIKMQLYFNQKNILSLYGFFDDDTYVYLILEYMEGGTLFSQLKKQKKLPQATVSRRMKQVLEGINYLHELNVAHRDLKPENIVMSNGVCKLCDFGWSAICDKRRQTLCGTIDYVATEVLKGQEYGLEIDLWCLGVLCYELLVGKAPFYHAKIKETMKKIINAETSEIKIPNQMSLQAKDFISKLIVKDPDQRMSAADALKHEFIQKHREQQLCVSPSKK